jgi:gluconokinase
MEGGEGGSEYSERMRARVGESGSVPGVLVVDVGSSSARCRLFDLAARGDDAGLESRAAYAWEVAGGAMERSAADLLMHVARTIDGGVARARVEGVEIVAVAVTTFWHSLVGVDRFGEPLTPLTGWADTRAAGTAACLAREVETGALHGRTGCFLHPSYPLVRLAWLRKEQPERFDAVRGWLSFGEFMEERLFGTRRCSLSIASGSGLLDVHRLAWDEEALEIAGIAADRLSPLVDAAEPLRGLRQPWADRWPELARVPWFPALGDGACANLGSGAVGPERLGITIGTSAAVRVLVEDSPGFRVPEELWAYRLDRSRWAVGRALSNGGNSVRFLRDVLQIPTGMELDELLRSGGAEEHGLTVLPFLLGERSPSLVGDVGAAVLGLRLDTTPAQIARAWLEAIGYRIAGVCESLERHFGARGTPRGSGGALNGSREWAQILADVLDRPLVLPAEREETSRGAALMALEALGAIPAGRIEEPVAAAEFRPDPLRHARHEREMRRHLQLERLLGAGDPGDADAPENDLWKQP